MRITRRLLHPSITPLSPYTTIILDYTMQMSVLIIIHPRVIDMSRLQVFRRQSRVPANSANASQREIAFTKESIQHCFLIIQFVSLFTVSQHLIRVEISPTKTPTSPPPNRLLEYRMSSKADLSGVQGLPVR
jgi:hypothetical protein